MFSLRRKPSGFTLAELVVATFIFVMCMTIIASSTVNFYRGSKRQLARNTLFEESRVLVDRMVRDIRLNTIDFDEYFNVLPTASGGPPLTTISTGDYDYGKYYRQYYHYFFFIDPPTVGASPCPDYGLNDPRRYNYGDTDPCRAQHVNEGNFSTGADNSIGNDDASLSALDADNEKEELYLISSDGKQKIILKRIGNNLDDDNDGTVDEGDATDTGREQVGLLILDLMDRYDNETIDSTPVTATDGYFDSWVGNIDFPDYTDSLGNDDSPFIAISPPSIEVTDLRFFISPIDDSHKAFNEADVEVQVHPSVTILLTTQVGADILKVFPSPTPPSITLQTTVSSRVYDNVLIPFEDV